MHRTQNNGYVESEQLSDPQDTIEWDEAVRWPNCGNIEDAGRPMKGAKYV